MSDAHLTMVTALVATVVAGGGQQVVAPPGAREATSAAATELTDVAPPVRPIASKTRTGRPVSGNEAYNRARAAEGRVGVRLGNDMSFRAD